MTPLEELDDGFAWYRAARDSLTRMRRLGDRHWDGLPWDGPLGRDDKFKEVESGKVTAEAVKALARLDELAVTVLFSIFEGAVRTAVVEQVRQASAALSHPVLRGAARDAAEAIDRGSFAAVLRAYSRGGHADAAEKVRQVRRYRNWISHGRRGKQLRPIPPQTVYDRLREFLEIVSPPPPPLLLADPTAASP